MTFLMHCTAPRRIYHYNRKQYSILPSATLNIKVGYNLYTWWQGYPHFCFRHVENFFDIKGKKT